MFSERWKLDAKCLNDETLQELMQDKTGPFFDLFFPESSGTGHKKLRDWKRRYVKNYCYGCDVRIQCENYALELRAAGEIVGGLWNGKSITQIVNERTDLSKRLRAQLERNLALLQGLPHSPTEVQEDDHNEPLDQSA